MRRKTALLLTLLFVVGMAAADHGHTGELTPTTPLIAVSLRPSFLASDGSSSFDSFVALGPSLGRLDGFDRRQWSEAIVEAIAESGWLGIEPRARGNGLSESLLRQVELGLNVPVGEDLAEENVRLRVRLNVKQNRPQVGLVLSW